MPDSRPAAISSSRHRGRTHRSRRTRLQGPRPGRHRRHLPELRGRARGLEGEGAAAVDNAHMRYYIVHLHRLLDPQAGSTLRHEPAETPWPQPRRPGSDRPPAGALSRLVCADEPLQLEPADLYGESSPMPFIVALWHGQHFMAPLSAPPGRAPRRDSCRIDDGELNAIALRHLGIGRSAARARAGGTQRSRGAPRPCAPCCRRCEAARTCSSRRTCPRWRAVRRGHRHARPHVRAPDRAGRRGDEPADRIRELGSASIGLPLGRGAMVAGRPVRVARDAAEAAVEEARLAVERELDRVTLAPSRSLAAVGRRRPLLADPTADDAGVYRILSSAMVPPSPRADQPAVEARQGRSGAVRRAPRPERRSRPAGPLVWLHGASVGEVLALLPLDRAAAGARPRIARDVGHGDLGCGARASGCPPTPSISSCRSTCRATSRAFWITGGPAGAVRRIRPVAEPDPVELPRGGCRSCWSTAACRSARFSAGSACPAPSRRCSASSTSAWRRSQTDADRFAALGQPRSWSREPQTRCAARRRPTPTSWSG